MEVSLRIFYPLDKDDSYKEGLNIYGPIFRPTGNIKRPWELIPNTTSNIGGIEYKVNSKGLRDYEYSYEKPEGVYRIIVLGDSVTMGSGVPFEEMYSKYLERLLNKKKQNNYEVIDLGVAGYTLEHEFEYLKQEGLKYNPDMIIFGYTLGDLEYKLEKIIKKWQIIENKTQNVEKVSETKTQTWICQVSFTKIKLPCGVINALRKVRTFTFIKYRWNNIRLKESNKDYYKELYYERRSITSLDETFSGISNISKDRNIPIIFVIFPQLFSDYKNYPYKSIHELVTSEMDKFNIQFIDLLGPYSQYPQPLYIAKIDPTHPKGEGHHIAAEIIYNTVFQKKD